MRLEGVTPTTLQIRQIAGGIGMHDASSVGKLRNITETAGQRFIISRIGRSVHHAFGQNWRTDEKHADAGSIGHGAVADPPEAV